MSRCYRPIRVPLATLLLLGCAVVASAQRPPTKLYYVQDHWTAWSPPTSFPEGAQVYVVEPGDTLWDLAARFYGDPYLWPQLWERNQYVKDAHWIYPGDPLVIGMEATPVSELEAPGPEAGEPAETPAKSPIGRFTGAPVPLGSEEDIYCSGFIGGENEAFAHTIIGSEYENLSPSLRPGESSRISGIYGAASTIKYELTTGDIVYLDGGRQAGIYPGSLFTAVTAGDRAVHPLTGEVLGRYYDYHGRVRVLSVQEETAIAEIVYSCDPITVGDRLEPFEPEPVPLGRLAPMRGVNDPVPRSELREAPAILRSRRDLVSLGIDHIVYIERDERRELVPGDVYSIYRLSAPGLPPVLIGELAVLTVRGRSGIARIVESRHTVQVGDRLAYKP